FVGLLPGWYPPNYDCGACGYATCAEFLHHTGTLRGQSAELEFTGPVCNLRDIDLGIAVGSAAKAAALHSIDRRCQTRVATAARPSPGPPTPPPCRCRCPKGPSGPPPPPPKPPSTPSTPRPPAPSRPASRAPPATAAPETARHHGNQFTAPGNERDRHQGL